jgi:hypothetical protein
MGDPFGELFICLIVEDKLRTVNSIQKTAFSVEYSLIEDKLKLLE